MKKVINITLGSIVFVIEQDAYDTLDAYIEQIKIRLKESEDQTEILSDIEAAIAEKFVALGRSERLAVTERDVAQVQKEMGSPADFGDAEDGAAASDPATIEQQSVPRRLFRDTDNAVIAGVAAGIARYFGIDPVIVRIVFVVAVFLNGVGILAYLILWLVVPAAKTTADKFAMQGVSVTVQDIADRVKKNVTERNLTDRTYVHGVWQTARGPLDRLFVLLGRVVRWLLHIARLVIGVGLVLGGALAIAALVSVYSIVFLSEKVFLPAHAQAVLTAMFANPTGLVAAGATFVVVLIPLLVSIVIGVSLLKKCNLFTTGKSVTLAVVWIVALGLAGTTTALQAERVWQAVGVHIDENGDFADIDSIVDEQGMRVIETPHPEAKPELPQAPEQPVEPVACTMDAKQCPDGSYVGRVGPDCAFALCP